MIATPATIQDFNNWEEMAKGASTIQLEYIIQDCRNAELAMRGWNPVREGYYSDQAATFAIELRRRKAAIASK